MPRQYNTKLTHEQLQDRDRNAARVQNDPVNQAAKLVGNWQSIPADQQDTIRYMLRPIVQSSGPSPGS
jgi:hypothetical protein